MLHYYRETDPPHSLLPSLREKLTSLGLPDDAEAVLSVRTESCFNVQIGGAGDGDVGVLDGESTSRLEWLLSETFVEGDRGGLRLETSSFDDENGAAASAAGSDRHSLTAEFGPRMTFTSAFSSNATSICAACGIISPPVSRLERSRRYLFSLSRPLSSRSAIDAVKAELYDRMTEEEYGSPLVDFDAGAVTEPVRTVPIMSEGRGALESINDEMGLGFDDFDLDYYTELFKVRRVDLRHVTRRRRRLHRRLGVFWVRLFFSSLKEKDEKTVTYREQWSVRFPF